MRRRHAGPRRFEGCRDGHPVWRPRPGSHGAALRVIALGVLLGMQLVAFLGQPTLAAAAGKVKPTAVATASRAATPTPAATASPSAKVTATPAPPTRSASWSEPVEVSGALGGWFPTVAADDTGGVSVVWQTDALDPLHHDVSGLYFTRWDGSKWSTPNDIALISPAGHALRSALVADSTGRLHLIYKGLGTLQPGALGEEKLWYTSALPEDASSARGWRQAVQVTRGSQGYYSDVALDSMGVIHVIWTESGAGSWGIYYSHSTDGGATWSPRIALDDVSPVWWYRAHLVVDSKDGLHVVWETLSSPGTADDPSAGLGATQATVYAQSNDGGQTWSRTYFREYLPPYLQLTTLDHGPQQPAIGVDGNGSTLLVYRAPRSSLVLYTESADGVRWSTPRPLPGIRVGVSRPYDEYDMVTDSAGHVHLAMVGYSGSSSTMSLLHLVWSGETWSLPEVVVNAPEYPEYPKLAISDGNQLHLVWFTGDKPSIDRTPTGVWYSTTTVAAPAMKSKVLPPPAQKLSPATLAISTPLSQATNPPAPLSSPSAAESPDAAPAPGLLDRLRARPDYPLLFTLLALAPVLVIYVGIQVGLSRLRR